VHTVGTPGASHFPGYLQKSERRIPRTLREVCDLSDEERPS